MEIYGHVLRASNDARVEGAVVTLYRRDHLDRKVVATASTNDNGRFQLVFSEGRRKPSEYQLTIAVNGRVVKIDSGPRRWSPSRAPSRWVLRVDIPAVERIDDVTPAAGSNGSVRGEVRHANGRPFDPPVMKLWTRKLGVSTEVSCTVTHPSSGGFLVDYTYAAGQDIYVTAEDGSGNEIARSSLLPDASSDEQVDLVVADGAYNGDPEYTQVHAALSAELTGADLDNLGTSDVRHMVQKHHLPARWVTAYLRAHHLAQTLDPSAEAIYGLLRQGVPHRKAQLLSYDEATIQAKLEAAADARQVPPSVGTGAATVATQLRDQAVARVLAPTTRGSVGEMLSKGAPSLTAQQQETFAKLWLDRRGRQFWDDLALESDFSNSADLAAAREAARQWTVVLGHSPMIEAFQTANPGKEARDMARLSAADWESLMADQVDGQDVDTPPWVTGATQGERRASYGVELERHAERCFPSPAIQAQQQRHDPGQTQDITKFYSNNQDFDFRNHVVEDYLATADTTGVGDVAGLENDLLVQARMFRVTSDVAGRGDAGRELASYGIGSALDIANKSSQRLVTAMDGSTIAEEDLLAIHNRAVVQAGAAVAMHLKNNPTDDADNSPYMDKGYDGSIELVPRYADQFSLSNCQCTDCLSTLSPAAYFVDLLHWIDGMDLLDGLTDRRPDLRQLELSCDNSHTAMPYADLAIEVFEAAVAAGSVPTATSRTTEELLAQPEHTNTDAYTTLGTAWYPLRELPYSHGQEQVSATMDHLGMAWAEFLQLFQIEGDPNSPDDDVVAAAQLGASQQLVAAITNDTVADYVQWGFASDQVPHPVTYDSVDWNVALRYVPMLMNRAQIDDLEFLRDVLHTRYVRGPNDTTTLVSNDGTGCDVTALYVGEVYDGLPAGTTPGEQAFTRLAIFLRLLRLTKLEPIELDKAMHAVGIVGPTSTVSTLDGDDLQALASFLAVRNAFPDVPLDEVSSWFSPTIDVFLDRDRPDAVLPLYDQRFLDPSSVTDPANSLFKLASGRTELESTEMIVTNLLASYEAEVVAALSVDADTVQKAAKHVAADLSLAGPDDLKGKLDHISRLVRKVSVAQAVDLDIDDYMAFAAASGQSMEAEADPASAERYVEALKELRAAGLEVSEVRWILGHHAESAALYSLGDDAKRDLLGTMRDDLIALGEDWPVPKEPTPDDLRRVLGQLVDDDDEAELLFQIGTKADDLTLTADEQEAKVDEHLGAYVDAATVREEVIGGTDKTWLITALPKGVRQVQSRARIATALAAAFELEVAHLDALVDLPFEALGDVSMHTVFTTGGFLTDGGSSADPWGDLDVETHPAAFAAIELMTKIARLVEAFAVTPEGLARWVMALDGVMGDGAAGTPGVYEDNFGDQELVAVGAVVDESQGVSGFTDSDYLEGSVVPTGATPDRTVAVRFSRPSTTGTHMLVCRQDNTGGGIEISVAGSTLYCRSFSATNQTVFSQSLSLAGTSQGDELWAFFLLGTEYGGTDTRSQMVWSEAGTRTLTLGTVKVHSYIHDLDNPVYIGRSHTTGESFGGTILQIASWDGKLTETQMQDVSDGTSNHSPDLGYFDNVVFPTPEVDLRLLELGSLPVTFDIDGVSTRYAALRRAMTWFGLPSTAGGAVDAWAETTERLRDGALSTFIDDLAVQTNAQAQDVSALVQRHGADAIDLVVNALAADVTVDIDGTEVSTTTAPFSSVTLALEAIRDAINADGTASAVVSATVLDAAGVDITTSSNAGVCVRLTPVATDLVDVSSADLVVRPALYDTRALYDLVRRVQGLRQLGISAATLDTWVVADPTQAVADAMRQTARQRYRSTSAWSKAFRPVRDKVRVRQQKALVAYLVATDNDVSHEEEQLFGKYLIDTQMDPCMLTSRLKQAIATVQLYVQRCLLGLEDGAELDEDEAERWEWMRQYRLWEANRKVFYYPENWLEPELRITRSEPFDEAASQLFEQEPTQERAEEVMAKYLEVFQSLANPSIISLVREPATETAPERIHFFGRDPDKGTLMYRRFDARAYWTPWETVDIEVHSDCIAPFVCNGRIFLLWIDIQLQINPDDPVQEEAVDHTDLDSSSAGVLVTRYAELRSTGWTGATSLRAFPVLGAYQRDDNYYALRTHVFPGSSRVLVELRQRGWHAAAEDHEQEPAAQAFQKHASSEVEQWMYRVGDRLVEVDNDVDATPDFLMGEDSDPIPGSHGVGVDGLEATFASDAHGDELDEPFGLMLLDGPNRDLSYMLAELSLRLMKIHPEDDRLLLRRPPVWVHLCAEPMVIQDTRRSFLVLPHALSEDMPTFVLETAAGDRTGVDGGHPSALYHYGVTEVLTSDTLGSAAVAGGAEPGTFTAAPMHHPFVSTVLEQLRTAGVQGVFRPAANSMHPDLAYQGAEATDVFEDYLPTGASSFVEPYPVDDITFAPNFAASFYNWEFFLHLPLLAVKQFRSAGKHEEAIRWLHLIFDPRRGPAEAWGLRPLSQPDDAAAVSWASMNDGDLVALKTFGAEVTAWLENPFDPHHVALLRPTAYKRKVMRTYVETLLDWGDERFAVDTLESLNEAVQLYLYAQSILGDRPIKARGEVSTATLAYADLENLDDMSNALVAIEDLLPEIPLVNAGKFADVPTAPMFDYFCTPKNDFISALFDRLEDRLYKIRHCMNIDGVTRTLPLFQPPIDPGSIIAALAGGASLGSALDVSPALAHHRFQPMLQRAKELTGTVRGLGQGMLSALEKRDGEELSLLRQRHELVMSDAVAAIREAQVDEAKLNLKAAEQGRVLAETRRDYYQDLIDKGSLSLELEEEDRNEKGYKRSQDASRAQIAASGLQLFPQLEVGAGKFSTHFGGLHLGTAASLASSLLSLRAAEHRYKGSNAARKAGQQRREQDWKQQLAMATKEIRQHDDQITAAEVRLKVAERELENHRLQRRHSEEVFAFIKDKFTNRELYAWMVRELSRMYSDTYQLALETARKAEAAFRYELGDPTASFVRWTNWDGLRKGLLSGERLSRDLERMEMAYMDRDVREYEVTKHLSLAELDPFALLTLQQTGSCYIDLPEVAFDLDFPSHYFRRLKKLSVSMPCVASRYGSVNAMLKMTKSKVRVSTDVTGGYAETTDDDRFRTSYRVEQVALSGAQNASGVFEMSAGDGRYLPFERRGVVCSLQLELPGHASLDPASISDVVFHLEYTAREAGGGSFLTAVNGSIDAALDALVEDYGVRKVISVKHDLPDAWHALMQPDAAATSVSVTFELGTSWLPYPLRGKAFEVSQLQVGLMGTPGSLSSPTVDITVASGPTTTTESLAAIADTPYAMGATVTPLDTLDATTSPSYTVTFSTTQIGNAGFGTGASPDRFDAEKLTDLVLVFDLTATGA